MSRQVIRAKAAYGTRAPELVGEGGHAVEVAGQPVVHGRPEVGPVLGAVRGHEAGVAEVGGPDRRGPALAGLEAGHQLGRRRPPRPPSTARAHDGVGGARGRTGPPKHAVERVESARSVPAAALGGIDHAVEDHGPHRIG